MSSLIFQINPSFKLQSEPKFNRNPKSGFKPMLRLTQFRNRSSVSKFRFDFDKIGFKSIWNLILASLYFSEC